MEEKKLTDKQKYLRSGLIIVPGILTLYGIDRFGYRLINHLLLNEASILFSSFLVITAMVICASRFISKRSAKWTAVIASVFETSTGQLVWLESANQPQPWPPAYFLTIILSAALFYMYGSLINFFVKQKYSD